MDLTPEILQRIASAEVTGRSSYIQKGSYTFIVKKVWTKGNGFKGQSAGAEFYVKEARALAAELAPNAVGSTCGFTVNFKNEMAFPNLSKFVAALIGLADLKPGTSKESPEFKARGAEILKALTELVDTGMGRGMEIKAETFDTVTKAGAAFLGVNYHHVTGQSQASVLANRALLDKLGT